MTGRPCETRILLTLPVLELETLLGVDDELLDEDDDDGVPLPVKETATVWLAEIALKV